MSSIHVKDVLVFTELPEECINDCSSSGDVSSIVNYWRKELGFTVDRDSSIQCLQGYGAWSKEELESLEDDDLAEKVLWLACNDFKEFITECRAANIDPRSEKADEFRSNCGSDIFVLE